MAEDENTDINNPDTRRLAQSPEGRTIKGCLPASIAAIAVLIAIIAVIGISKVISSDEPIPADTSAASAEPTPDTTADEAEDEDDDDAEDEEESEDEGEGTSEFGPPDKASLPPGAILVTGRSGGQIGCIACDGQFRYLSLKSRGVFKTPADANTLWKQTGQVLQFGARLSGENTGRYGVNLYIDGKEYGPGVALETGHSSAVTKFDGNGPLEAGHDLSVIIGEAGTLTADGSTVAEVGADSLSWWFVFQPDAAQ